ncbi:hypothetical protein I553_1247 [Mycobacterium xenopi 4042]|uniref:Uncharacterized protein n=1 Tax=Mycobacterium xenopi 4042 TaxID=1299334 RepID=X7Z9V4_MYCXE|nr:hypothetical protein I553_1247 [Mycobacterium xenopi 4042]
MTIGSVASSTSPNTDVNQGPRSGLRHRKRPRSRTDAPLSWPRPCRQNDLSQVGHSIR